MMSKKVSRRRFLRTLGGAAALGALGRRKATAQTGGRPVTLTYWYWSDNPTHQKLYLDAIERFHKKQSAIRINADGSPTVLELRKKLISAAAVGAAPDMCAAFGPWAQEFYENDILLPVEDMFNKWERKADFFPGVLAACRGKDQKQPILYVANGMIVYIQFYRADLVAQAGIKPPDTFEEMISAAKVLTKAPDRYGYALRGGDYFGTAPVEQWWMANGVKMVDEKGNVDFDSPAAAEITEKFVGMHTKDKSAPPSAVSDRFPQLFALFETGKLAMWNYPLIAWDRLAKAHGDNVTATLTPKVKQKRVVQAYPEGNFILKGTREKNAAWEFVKHLSDVEEARVLDQIRGYVPTLRSVAAEPFFKENRFFRAAVASEPYWQDSPKWWKNWFAYQDGITPHWQRLLRQEISASQFQQEGAKLLRGA